MRGGLRLTPYFCTHCKMDFIVHSDAPVKSFKELLKFFYKYHSQYIKRRRVGCNPIAFILNPPQFADETNPFSSDAYYAVYCRGFFVIIDCNIHHPHTGPHAAKLWKEVYPPSGSREAFRIHLATMQIEGSFFNVKAIRVALREAIAKREYFMPPAWEENLVEFIDPNEEEIQI